MLVLLLALSSQLTAPAPDARRPLPPQGVAQDSDADGLSDRLERLIGSDPDVKEERVTLTARVVFPDGQPAAGAELFPSGAAVGPFLATSDPQGVFTIEGWPVALLPVDVHARVTSSVGVHRGPFEGTFTFEARAPRALAEHALDSSSIREANAPGREDLLLRPAREDVFPTRHLSFRGSGVVPLVADLNGDGRADVLTGTRTQLGIGLGDFETVTNGGAPGSSCPEREQARAIGDVDGDGILDVVSSGRRECTFAFLVYPHHTWLGRGDGTFALQPPLASSPGGWGVALGDVDNDGVLDLVSTGVDDDTGFEAASVRRGRGDGTWDAPSLLEPMQPRAIDGGLAVCDMDLDGYQDVVLSERSVQVFSAAPGLDLSLTGEHPLGPGVFRAVPHCVDFDGDGRPDVVATSPNGSCFALLGLGNGTLRPPTRIGAATESSAFADLDFDGRLDWVYTRRNAALRFLGRGLQRPNGTFQLRNFTEYRAIRVALGDFDSDGFPDLYANDSNDSKVAFNNRRGNFLVGLPRLDLAGGFGIQGGDVNGDGTPDLVNHRQNDLTVRLGDGDGGFLGRRVRSATLLYAEVADLTGDGRSDVLGFRELNSDHDYELRLFTGSATGPPLNAATTVGSGNFELRRTLPGGMLLAHFDRDRIHDLLLWNRDEIQVRRGLTPDSFADPVVLPLTPVDRFQALDLADLNADGRMDVVVYDLRAPVQNPQFIRVALSMPDGSFQAGPSLELGGVPGGEPERFFRVLHVDADPFPDLLYVPTSSGLTQPVFVYSGLGDGGFVRAPDLPLTLSSLAAIESADLDLNGHPDLIFRPRPRFFVFDADYPSDSLQIFYRDGTDDLDGPYGHTLQGGTRLVIEDFDGDGDPDVITASGGSLLNRVR